MAIQVPTYDFNGAQVKVNLRTVAGVRQLFRVQFVRSDGSVVSMDGQKFTGRVNTSPVTEFECVGNEDGVDIVWGKLPAGRFSYEVCCGSQVVFYGDMIVQGRMLPPLEGEGDVSVNDSLVMSVEADSEGRIVFECSEVGLMTLLERQAMFYMGESKELRDEVYKLHHDVDGKILEAKSDIAQMLESATEAQTNAQHSATLASEFAEQVETTHGLVEDLATQAKSDAEVASRAKVSAENTLASVGGYAQRAEQAKLEAEQAKASAEQEAYNAYSHGSAAKTSAEVAISKATEASASAELAEGKAEEAKESAEIAESKLKDFKEYAYDKSTSDGKYAQRDSINYFNKGNTFRDKTSFEDDVYLTRTSTEFVGEKSVLNRGENDKRYGLLGGVNLWLTENKFNGSISFSAGNSVIYGGAGDTLCIESGSGVNITGNNLYFNSGSAIFNSNVIVNGGLSFAQGAARIEETDENATLEIESAADVSIKGKVVYLDGGQLLHIMSDAWLHNSNSFNVSGKMSCGGLTVQGDFGSSGNGSFYGNVTTRTGIHALPLGTTTALGAPAYGLSVSADGGLQLFGNHFMLSDGWSDTALKVVNNAVGLTSTDEASLSFDYANTVHFRTMPNDGDGNGVYRFECWKWEDDSHTQKVLGACDVQKNNASQLNSTSLLNLSELNDYFLRKNFRLDQHVDSFVTFGNGIGTDSLSLGSLFLVEGRVNGGLQALQLGNNLITGAAEYGLSVVDVWASGEVLAKNGLKLPIGGDNTNTVHLTTGSIYEGNVNALVVDGAIKTGCIIQCCHLETSGNIWALVDSGSASANFMYSLTDSQFVMSRELSVPGLVIDGKTIDELVEEKVTAILTEKGLI